MIVTPKGYRKATREDMTQAIQNFCYGLLDIAESLSPDALLHYAKPFLYRSQKTVNHQDMLLGHILYDFVVYLYFCIDTLYFLQIAIP